ncbi:MAG: PstS family phosphate ABC transporter substrate-binding protein [Ignavibacteriales bacterium]|nr:PstS family phosphate ABC transporter substrate-binding protein [Ignavibacteriales bacterium]MBP9119624.1 PstS family phosphate ABC transporter substrate-binding protein [Ignavibacterium sp.]
MKREKILTYLLAVLVIVPMLFIGCKKKTDEVEKTVITIKGSDTMVNLSQKWAEEYMKLHPDVSIQVTGGGSGTGVASLLNKTTEIANSSRELKSAELDDAKAKGVTPFVYQVALDGIAVIVHPESKVDNLTIQQVSDIFSGKITNWKSVGGVDMPITLYGRENSSGTYEFFKEHVLGKVNGKQVDYSTATQVLQGTAALGEAVARDKKGIGYGGVGYFAERNDVKILHIKKDENSIAISPAENNKVNYDVIWSGDYSISRYLYCFTNGEATGKLKEFMDFIVSQEGQDVVRTMEYIPLPPKK